MTDKRRTRWWDDSGTSIDVEAIFCVGDDGNRWWQISDFDDGIDHRRFFRHQLGIILLTLREKNLCSNWNRIPSDRVPAQSRRTRLGSTTGISGRRFFSVFIYCIPPRHSDVHDLRSTIILHPIPRHRPDPDVRDGHIVNIPIMIATTTDFTITTTITRCV